MVGGGPHTSPVSWVSAPGGQRHSLGGVGRSAHQMTSHPSIDLFIVVPVVPAYSGELGLALCTRAWVCSDMEFGVGGVERGGIQGLS